MATLPYLWANRFKAPFGSKAFFKSWAKRLLLLPALFSSNYRRYALIRRGGTISKTAEIGHLKSDGKASNLKVGDFSTLGRVNIALHDKVEVGRNVVVNDGVTILTASHDVQSKDWVQISSPIIVQDYAWVSMNATILPGVTIGCGAVVGAGAVVAKDVAPYTVVVGNPAKVLKTVRTTNLDYNPCAFLALNNAWLVE